MSPSDNSFTDNMSAVDRIYATHSGVAIPDEDGNVSVDHIDGEEDTRGEPIDLAARDAEPSSRGGELTAEEQKRLGEELPNSSEPEEPADQLSGVNANPEGSVPDPDGDPAATPPEGVDPESVSEDALTEEQLEALTAPEGEEQS